MAGETLITLVGNLTADPELRYTQNGLAVVNFTIASTPRTFDRQSNEWKDGEALFIRCSAWREFAEQIAGSVYKGTRVIAQGFLKQRSYETKPTDGSAPEKRTSFELEVQEIGPSLRYAMAQVQKVTRTGAPAGQGHPAGGWGGQQQGSGGGWPQQGQQQGGYPQQGQPQGQPQQGGFQGPPQQHPAAPPQQQPDVWSTPGAPQYGDDTPF